MDLKQLKALVTVAESGSVTRAAELLHLVQPAVTRQIRALEEELGVPLFERTRQGMRATEAGATMVERARRALDELERARAEIRPEPGMVTGIVTVGLLTSATDLLVEPLVSSVRASQPGIQLRLVTAYSGHLRAWLDAGDLDMTLLYDVASTPSLNGIPLVRERLWVVAPRAVGLSPERPVAFAEAAAHPIVMPAAGHGLRALVDTAASRAGTDLQVAVETNDMVLQKQLVRGGHGWTILPGVAVAADVQAGLLSAAPLREPHMSRGITLALPRTGRTPAGVDVVARELVRQVRQAVQQGRWPSAELAPTGT